MKKNVRILIVEDEFITSDAIRSYLEESGYEVSGDAMRAEEAIEILERGDTDLAILDINIKGEKDGIWLAAQIRERFHLPFIFLSAFSDPETIQAATRTRPFGYLVKPFTQADLFAAIEVALQNFAEQMEPLKLPIDHTRVSSELLINEAIFVKDGLIFQKINLAEIQFVQAYKNYIELRLVGGQRHVIRSTMANLLGVLPKNHFVQAHRSFVINTQFVEKLGASFVQIGGEEIPISRGFREDILARFKFFY